MRLTSINHTVSLLYRLFDSRHSTVPIIETKPQKPSYVASPIYLPFERVTPETQNVPSEQIVAFIDALVRDKTLNMHNLMILRNGKIICETSFGEQDISLWKSTYSACKSITSLAIGMLIDEGKLHLDDKLVSLFAKQTTPISRLRFNDLTVRALLTMTSAVVFNEAECMTETDWVKSFLNSATRGEIGKTFNYNSLNTYMLSAIVREVSGKGLTEYLEERLFKPLGISNVFWEKCPNGIEKGGWGLYIRPEDIAKIGQLILQNGIWRDKQIVSSAWIEEATTKHMSTPGIYGEYDYGYQIWVGREQNSFLFNGMLGQNVLGFRNNGILVVTNAGNDETFQQSNYFSLVHKYFAPSFQKKLKENPAAYRALNKCLQELKPNVEKEQAKRWWKTFSRRQAAALHEECYFLCKKSYIVKDNLAAAVGLLPVVLQAIQNNYTKGLQAISFTIEDDKFVAYYHENDEVYRFAIGFDKAEITELSFRGEPYLVSTVGKFSTDEDENKVLKIKMDFLETPCTRLIKLFFVNDAVEFCQTEKPGKHFILQNVLLVKDEIERYPVIGSAIAKFGDDYLEYKIEKIFEPKIELLPQDLK